MIFHTVTSSPSRLFAPVSKLSWRLCKSSVKLTKWPNPCVAWPSVPTVSEEQPLTVQSMELTAHQSPPLKDENFRHKKGQTLPPNPWWTMLRAKHKIHPILKFHMWKKKHKCAWAKQKFDKLFLWKTCKLRFKNCFAQTWLRVQIRESFSRETRNLFYTPPNRTCFF